MPGNPISDQLNSESHRAAGSANGQEEPKGRTGANLNAWPQRSWLRTAPLVRTLLVLLILIASLWLAATLWLAISYFGSLLLLFFAAWLLALMLTPVIRLMVGWGWPKAVAIGVTYILLLGSVSGFLVLVLPGLIAQTQLLSNNLGSLTGQLESGLRGLLKSFGLTDINLADLSRQLQNFGTDLLKNALGVATGIAGFLLQLVLLFIISVSLLAGREFDKTVETKKAGKSLWNRLPKRYRERVDFVRRSFERNFGAFLLGQTVVAVIYGLATWIVMWIAGFDYPVTTGCICGALMLIPFFGGPLSLLPPLIVAFSRNDSPIVVVLVLLLALQTALLNVVLPKLIGRSSGVGPVTTLFVLLAGAQVGGVFGVILSVPIAGVIKSLVDGLLSEYLQHEEDIAASTELSPTKVEVERTSLVVVEKPAG